jgi:hypothetical protein
MEVEGYFRERDLKSFEGTVLLIIIKFTEIKWFSYAVGDALVTAIQWLTYLLEMFCSSSDWTDRGTDSEPQMLYVPADTVLVYQRHLVLARLNWIGCCWCCSRPGWPVLRRASHDAGCNRSPVQYVAAAIASHVCYWLNGAVRADCRPVCFRWSAAWHEV